MIEKGYNTLMDGMSTDECLMKFALHYVPSDNQYDSYAKKYLEGADGLSMFSHLIFKEDGNLSHTVGTGEENKDEQYQHPCSVSLQYMGVALHVIIHVNAESNGKKWHNATGWCCYTYYGHSLSDELATCLYKAARQHLSSHKLRTDYSDGDPDLESDEGKIAIIAAS